MNERSSSARMCPEHNRNIVVMDYIWNSLPRERRQDCICEYRAGAAPAPEPQVEEPQVEEPQEYSELDYED